MSICSVVAMMMSSGMVCTAEWAIRRHNWRKKIVSEPKASASWLALVPKWVTPHQKRELSHLTTLLSIVVLKLVCRPTDSTWISATTTAISGRSIELTQARSSS